MARMIPPTVELDGRSGAERKMFHRFRDELDDSWIGLHSVGVFTHQHKRYTEIDFVLVGPPGVICVEVKGGRIRREGGFWYFTDAHDRTTRRRQGPFEQVAGAEAALWAWLRDAHPGWERARLGFAVATPEMDFDARGPDIEPRIVFDLGRKNITTWLDDVQTYWHERMGGTAPDESLTEVEVVAIANVLRGDFDIDTPGWERQRIALERQTGPTEEQHLVLADERDRIVVEGDVGTGKTLLAETLARKAHAAGSRVLVCCGNAPLSESMRRRLGVEEEVEVVYSGGAIPDVSYDYLVVDDARAVAPSDQLHRVLKGGLTGGRWAVFTSADHWVQSPADASNAYAASGQHTLSLNTRSAPSVLVTTGLVVGRHLGVGLLAEGPESVVHWYRDDDVQQRRVADVLQFWMSDRVKPADVTLLASHPSQHSIAAEACRRIGMPLTDVNDATADGIRFSAIDGFRGRESDAVLVLGVDDLSTHAAKRMWRLAGGAARFRVAFMLDEVVRADYLENTRAFGRQLLGT